MPYAKDMTGIYCIRHGDKFYVGQSTVIKRRFSNHRIELTKGVHCNQKLQRSANKYGISSLEFEIIEICDVNLLTEREQYWVTTLDSIKHGYNICDPIEPSRNRVVSDAMKKRLSDLAKTRPCPLLWPDTIAKCRAAIKANSDAVKRRRSSMNDEQLFNDLSPSERKFRYGNIRVDGISKEQISQMSYSEIINLQDVARCQKQQRDEIKKSQLPEYGLSKSEKIKLRYEKKRTAMLFMTKEEQISHKRKFTADHKAKIGDANRGKTRSVASREKQSESMKALHLTMSDENKAQLIKRNKARVMTEETRQKKMASSNSKTGLQGARAIRDDYSNGGITYSQLAAKYKLHEDNVYQILANKIWIESEFILDDVGNKIENPSFVPPRQPVVKFKQKLTLEIAEQIRNDRFVNHKTYKELSASYGVNQSHLWRILHGGAWKPKS